MIIPTIKIVEIDLNRFHFMSGVLPRCYFSFSLPEKADVTA
jgi:hypothetical protein